MDAKGTIQICQMVSNSICQVLLQQKVSFQPSLLLCQDVWNWNSNWIGDFISHQGQKFCWCPFKVFDSNFSAFMVLENHRKSLGQHFERSYVYNLSAQKHIKTAKVVYLSGLWNPEACGQTVLPDRSSPKGQKCLNYKNNSASLWFQVILTLKLLKQQHSLDVV